MTMAVAVALYWRLQSENELWRFRYVSMDTHREEQTKFTAIADAFRSIQCCYY
jgi:hypothetical protein